jgi:hypothetical protein
MKYRLHLLNRHLFLDLPEGLTLVDTGAPYSASTTGALTWEGRSIPVRQGGYLGFTFDQLSHEIGLQIKGLLGMDVLARASLHFSLGSEELQVGAPLPADTPAHPHYLYMVVSGFELPLFSVRLNGHPAKVAWDTGAQFGYVADARFLAGLRPEKGFHDFSPLFGDLDPQESFEVPFELGQKSFTERVALAPEVGGGGISPLPLRPFLRQVGIDAIIGPRFLETTDLWLDPTRRLYALVPLTS